MAGNDPRAVPSLESEEELSDIEYYPKEDEEIDFDAPPKNLVRILYGLSDSILLNISCRKQVFMNCLTKKVDAKCHIPPGASLDLCSESGTLLKLERLAASQHIDHLFVHGYTYIPCVVARTDAGFLESIEPCLRSWDKLYPRFPALFNRSIQQDREVACGGIAESDAMPGLESDELSDIEYYVREGEEVDFDAPPKNVIRLLYGVSDSLLLNINCRRQVFMNYLTRKIGANIRMSPRASLDLCSQGGILLKLESVDANQNISHLFVHGYTYIPCVVARTDAGFLESIKPYLKSYDKLYPRLPDFFNTSIQKDQEEARERGILTTADTAAAAHSGENTDRWVRDLEVGLCYDSVSGMLEMTMCSHASIVDEHLQR